jgi:ribosomal protein S18 acetylase RimI-like enzyme
MVRNARPDEIGRVADLHAQRIADGFLASLGPRFLRTLYRRVDRSPHAFLIVAVEGDEVAGFLAGAIDIGSFYRSFVTRDGLRAGIAAGPRLLRSLPRAFETLRYPSSGRGGGQDLPAAEVLSVAVDPQWTGHGVGRALVDAGTAELRRRGVQEAKVVAGADNTAALRLYEGAGFERHSRIAVHRGTDSEVLVWTSSSP